MRHAILVAIIVLFGAGCSGIQVAGEVSYSRGGAAVSVHFR
jgi:PBP1b-binding outer membrane lipoprotein LpoB